MSSSVKFRSGLAFLTASLIFPCSSGVTLFGLATSTASGALTPSLLSSCFTVFSAGIVPRTLPSLSFTVTVPSSATSTFAPSGRFGFAFLTASSTAFLFSAVNAFALSTFIGVSGAFISSAFFTAFSAGIVPRTLSSLSVTVTVPSLPTVTFASAGNVGFAFLTASSTAPFSSFVKLVGSFTSTGLAGATISPAFLTV